MAVLFNQLMSGNKYLEATCVNHAYTISHRLVAMISLGQ